MGTATSGSWVRQLSLLLAAATALLAGHVHETRAEDPAPAPCVLCAAAGSVSCPSCAGKGRGPGACDVCDGVGRTRCRYRREAMDDPLVSALAKLWGHDGSSRDCPNYFCQDGKVVWDDGKSYSCKLCGATGRVKCIACQAAQSPCAACSGRGKVDGACRDCAGTGKLPCLVCANQGAKCPQCRGAKHLECPVCDTTGSAVQACMKCAGRGLEVCSACSGIGKAYCSDCSACGRYKARYIGGGAAASTHCPKCDGKGAFDCSNCSSGRVKCSSCDGTKRTAQECLACEGTGKLGCRSCGEWGCRVPEVEASMLDKSDAKPEARQAALVLYERAGRSAKASIDRWQTAALKAAKLPSYPERPAVTPDPDRTAAAWLAYEQRCASVREQRDAQLAELIQAMDRGQVFVSVLTRITKSIARLRPTIAAPPPK